MEVTECPDMTSGWADSIFLSLSGWLAGVVGRAAGVCVCVCLYHTVISPSMAVAAASADGGICGDRWR